jgi:hypothetical protein
VHTAQLAHAGGEFFGAIRNVARAAYETSSGVSLGATVKTIVDTGVAAASSAQCFAPISAQ